MKTYLKIQKQIRNVINLFNHIVSHIACYYCIKLRTCFIKRTMQSLSTMMLFVLGCNNL